MRINKSLLTLAMGMAMAHASKEQQPPVKAPKQSFTSKRKQAEYNRLSRKKGR